MLRDVSNTGDLSPTRQQHDKHHSSDDNETTRRIALRATATQRTTTRFTASFLTIGRNI